MPELYKPLRGVAVATMALLGLNAAMSLATLASGLMQLALVERIARGDYTDAEIVANDARAMWLGFGSMGLYVLTAIVFVVWFHRAYGNTRAFDYTPAHGTGWAIGGWFVPILSLFRPFQIAREIWHASEPRAPEDAIAAGTSPPLLVAWWTFWILGNVLGQVSFRLSMSAETPGEVTTSTSANLAVDVVNLISVPLAILVVRELTRRQETHAQRLSGDPAPLTF